MQKPDVSPEQYQVCSPTTTNKEVFEKNKTLTNTLTSDIKPSEQEKINVCILNNLVYGILLTLAGLPN